MILIGLLASFLRWKGQVALLTSVRHNLTGIQSFHGKVLSDVLFFSKFVDLDVEGYKVRCFFKGKLPPVEYRDVMVVKGVAFVPYSYKNPGSFSVVDYMNRENIALYLKVRSWQVLRKERGILSLLHSFRRSLALHAAKFDSPLREFLLSVVLGFKEASRSFKGKFYKLGLGHIFAISGLHFGIFIFVLYFFFRVLLRLVNFLWGLPFFLLPIRSAHIFVLAFVPVLLILTGNHISAQRAALMYVIYVIFGVFMEREVKLHKAVLLTLVAFSTVSPEQLVSPGFQYTFLAVFLIGLIRDRFRDLGNFSFSVILSVVLPLLLFPVSAYHFHKVYPFAPVFNTLLLPVFSLFIVASFVGLFLTALVPHLSLVFNHVSSLLSVVFDLTDTFSDLPVAEIYVSKAGFFFIIGFAFLILSVLLGRKTMLIGALCFLMLFVWELRVQRKNKVVFFDTGRRGDAALVVFNDRIFLVNAGGKGRMGASSIFSSLVWLGVDRIDKAFCLSRSKYSCNWLPYIRRRIPVEKVVRLNCTPIKLGGVRFTCYEYMCAPSKLCKVFEGPLVLEGERILIHKRGALALDLEVR